MSGPAVCAKCRHRARGEAVYSSPIHAPGRPWRGAPRRGSDYICAREGLTREPPDPVTGFTGPLRGPACRDLNPDGRCKHYSTGFPWPAVAVAAAAAALLLIVALFVQALMMFAGAP